MQAKIGDSNALLKNKSPTGKLKILFSSRIAKTEVKLDGGTNKAVGADRTTKKEPVNEKQFVHNLTSSLNQLEKSIGDIQTHGLVIEHFKKDATFPEKLAIFRDKFITGLFGKILNKISSEVFLGDKPLARAKKEMADLKPKLDKLTTKMNELQAKQNEAQTSLKKMIGEDKLKIFKHLRLEIAMKVSEKEGLEAKIKEAGKKDKSKVPELQRILEGKNTGIKELQKRLESEKNALKKKLGNNFNSFETSIDQYDQLEQQVNKVSSEKLKLEGQVKKVQEKLDKAESGAKLGQETRANLHTIGGVNVKLELQDATLDGTYISADSFRSTLKEGGAQTYELKIKTRDGKDISLKGLTFPKEASGGVVDKALNALGAFGRPDPNKRGAGWQKLSLKDGSTLIVTDEEATKLQEMGLVKDGKFTTHPGDEMQFSKQDWDTSKPGTGGTVLLTSGNAGVYEMHKREMLSFLMRGMNVMAFNFRGYGESQGTPTGEGLKRDMEAAYQYLKTQHNVPDEKIMVKALCMSGGPAADLAAHHPDVNLFIDQSYAHFEDVVAEQAKSDIQGFIKENHLDSDALKALKGWVKKQITPIAHAAVKLAAPAWSVANEIGKVRGHVGILLTKQDTFMTLDRDVQKNYAAAMKGKKAQSVTLMAMEGKHGECWINPRSSADIIKPIKPEAAAKILAAMPKGASALPETYSVRVGLAIETVVKHNLQEFIAKFPKENPQNLLEYAHGAMQLLNKKLLLRMSDKQTMSKTDFEDTVNKLVASANQHIREPLRELLMASFRDEFAPYRQTIISGEQLDKKIADALAKHPEIRAPGIDKDLVNKLNVFKALLNKGASVEQAMAQATNIDPKFRALVKDFLTGVVVAQDPFLGLQKKIAEQIKTKDLSPKQADAWIKQFTASLPKESQAHFQEFITKAIPISADVLQDENFQAKRYEGRVQMDQYLQKAKLMGSLI